MPNNINWPGWDVVNCIGKGGFGAVYEIRREVFGDIERCALKVITIPKDSGEIEYMRCEGMDDDSITSTLHSQVGDIINEYKLMMRMRENPNIVHCGDFRYTRHENDLGWDIYIKMELLTPLLKVLDRMNDEKEIVRLGIELCNAIVACQKHNIIHRDIKPQNIFISPEGFYKLGDFGIARTMEHTTKATAGIGTYSFMAPEVALGKSYGPTVDIYSLGLVLYWLLNERRGPFVPLPPEMPTFANNDLARTRRYAGEPIPAPKNGHEKLKTVVLKACAFEPKERYQTAQEMMEALNGVYQILDEKTAVQIIDNGKLDCGTDEETVIDLQCQQDSVEPQKSANKDDKHNEHRTESGVVQPEYGTMLDEDILPNDGIILENKDNLDSVQQEKTLDSLDQAEKNSEKKDISSQKDIVGKDKKKKIWPWVSIAAAATIVVAVLSLPNGWKKTEDDYYYYQAGMKAKGQVTIDGEEYFFDSEGIMRTGWLELDGQKYYFGTDGRMVTGRQIINGSQYYLAEDGVMQTGWVNLSGKMYYYGDDGARTYGNWKEENGQILYYMNGEKLVGSHLIDKEGYYFNENGVMQTGWVTLSDGKHYYDKNGKMVRSEQIIISDEAYKFDERGRLIETRTFDKNGKLIKKVSIFEKPASRDSSDETYYKMNNGQRGSGRYQVLNDPIENCARLTVTVGVFDVKSGHVDEWGFYIRDLNGKWSRIGDINVDNNKAGTATFNFDSLVSFDAYVCFCESLGTYWEFSFSQTLSNIEVVELY